MVSVSEFTRIMMGADQRGPVDGRNVDEQEVPRADIAARAPSVNEGEHRPRRMRTTVGQVCHINMDHFDRKMKTTHELLNLAKVRVQERVREPAEPKEQQSVSPLPSSPEHTHASRSPDS